jgi:hypothetical protein
VSTWALIATVLLYLLTAYDLFRQGQHGLSLAFLCYALANVGLIWAAKQSVTP